MAAAGLILHTASLAAEATAIAIVFFTLVATSTVMAPVLLTYLAPARMEPRLVAARTWVADQGARADGRHHARDRGPHPPAGPDAPVTSASPAKGEAGPQPAA